MPLSQKPLDKIDEADLQALKDNKVQESSTIEYKSALPGNTDDEKKEFLADVSSFANSAGGHLIYGIREASGIPDQVVGVSAASIDKELQRLENLIRDGLEPPVGGIGMQSVPLPSLGGVAIVIRIPKSWAAPHVVALGRHWKRFYGRNSTGKYQLDMSELRAAFALSDAAGERIRSFRVSRVNSILSGESPDPVPFDAGPRFILHLVPFSSVNLGVSLNLSDLPNDTQDVIAGIHGYRALRFNFDGFLIYNVIYDLSQRSVSNAYSQFFKNGSIETSKRLPLVPEKGDKILNPTAFENELIHEILPKLLAVQKRIGATPPIAVMLTVAEVAGYQLWPQSPWGRTQPTPEIDRDVLYVPEILIESFTENPMSFMQPIFDTIWNAAGWPRAMTYDFPGKWTPWPKP